MKKHQERDKNFVVNTSWNQLQNTTKQQLI